MVLALLTIIRPIQIPPVWSVQKAAAERMGKTVQRQAKPALRIIDPANRSGM